MPVELPFCRGEYGWSQAQPNPATIIALLHLPHRCSIAVRCGRDSRQQTLTLSLVQSATGLGHLVLSDLEHSGCSDESAVTEDLFRLLMNTTVTLMRHHCALQITLGGQVPCWLQVGGQRLALSWEHWGFQLLSAPAADCIRLLARVRSLKCFKLPSLTDAFPTLLAHDQLQWSAA